MAKSTKNTKTVTKKVTKPTKEVKETKKISKELDEKIEKEIKTTEKKSEVKETEKKSEVKETNKEVTEEFDKKEAVKDLANNEANKNKIVVAEDEKSLAHRIFDVVFWVVIIGLAIIWLTEFINVKNDKEPVFCISKKTHQFDDGTVSECVGLGYKVFNYNRSSFEHGRQFGPFFIGMKEK